jgi:DNA (cytosine-5)-methyltransferase 1
LHLLAGCPPCQGFSRIRTLNGAREGDHDKNDLIWSFFDFIREFEPKAVLLENVTGLGSDERFHLLKKQLEIDLGYNVTHEILNAAEYGVPQNRKRFVMVAAKNFIPVLSAPAAPRTTVREAFAGLPPQGESHDVLHDYTEKRAQHVQRIIAAIPVNGGSRRDLPPDLILACHRKHDGFSDVYGRMHWDRPAPTITGGCINPSKGRFLHPSEPRAITLREAALLQGFPRNYKFDLSRGRYVAAQMIGNAFPPAFAAHQARSIAKHIRGYEKSQVSK